MLEESWKSWRMRWLRLLKIGVRPAEEFRSRRLSFYTPTDLGYSPNADLAVLTAFRSWSPQYQGAELRVVSSWTQALVTYGNPDPAIPFFAILDSRNNYFSLTVRFVPKIVIYFSWVWWYHWRTPMIPVVVRKNRKTQDRICLLHELEEWMEPQGVSLWAPAWLSMGAPRDTIFHEIDQVVWCSRSLVSRTAWRPDTCHRKTSM